VKFKLFNFAYFSGEGLIMKLLILIGFLILISGSLQKRTWKFFFFFFVLSVFVTIIHLKEELESHSKKRRSWIFSHFAST